MLSIIIPVQNIKKDKNLKYFYKPVFGIVQTIESIKQHINVPFEIILVINDEKNTDLIEYAKNEKIISKYIICSCNVGVSRAWNIGANLAEGNSLCFCNDDVEFAPRSFIKCLNVFNDFENVGQVGPEGSLWHIDKPGKYVGLNKIEETDAVSGYFFIIPSKVYTKTGGFDNYYTPAGCEEIDISFKIRSLGYKCLVIPETGIIHHGNHGISSRNTDIHYLTSTINTAVLDKRNKEYFVKKWYPHIK